MQSLAHIKDANTIASGIFIDSASGQDAPWRDAENVHFTNGEIQAVKGYVSLQSGLARVVALDQAFVEGERRIYWATETSIYKLVENVNTGLVLGKSAGKWSLETWGSFLLATNNIDKPLVWKNTGSMVDLANAPTKVSIFRKLDNHLLAFGVNGDGQSMSWCSLDDIETWTPLPENTAGDLFLRDLDSEIRAVESLGNVLLVYSVNTVGVVQYLGSPYYFGFQKSLDGIGAVGKDAITAVNKVHYGLCRKGFFRTDGSTFEYIHNPQIYKWFDEQIDWQIAETTCSWYDETTNFVYWFFTCEDSERRGVGYNIATGAWSKFKLPIYAGMDKKIFSYSVIGVNNLLCAWNRAGIDVPWTLNSGRFDFGDRNHWKKIEMVQINGENKTGVEYSLGFSESSDRDAAVTWTAWADLEADNYIYPTDCVFLELKLRGSGGGFQFGSLQVFGEPTAWR